MAKDFEVQYIPPPVPPPGKIWIKSPSDKLGTKLCPDLHLTPELAEQLIEALNEGIRLYLEAGG